MPFWNPHLYELSWKTSLALKSAILVVGIAGIMWMGWPSAPIGELGSDLPTVVVSQPQKFPVVSVRHNFSKKPPGRNVVSNLQKPGRRIGDLALSVDLNHSSQQDLEALPGIGPVLADRIVTYRSANGNFQHIDELVNVSGIGQKRLQQLQPFVKVKSTVDNLGS